MQVERCDAIPRSEDVLGQYPRMPNGNDAVDRTSRCVPSQNRVIPLLIRDKHNGMFGRTFSYLGASPPFAFAARIRARNWDLNICLRGNFEESNIGELCERSLPKEHHTPRTGRFCRHAYFDAGCPVLGD